MSRSISQNSSEAVGLTVNRKQRPNGETFQLATIQVAPQGPDRVGAENLSLTFVHGDSSSGFAVIPQNIIYSDGQTCTGDRTEISQTYASSRIKLVDTPPRDKSACTLTEEEHTHWCSSMAYFARSISTFFLAANLLLT